MKRLSIDGRPLSLYTRGGSWVPAPHGMPPEVRIGGDVWRVVYCVPIYSSRAKSSRLAGAAIHHEKLIVLDPSTPFHEMREGLR